MLNLYKYLGLLLGLTIVFGQRPKTLDEFVFHHLLLTKSKMESSPMVWQDVREGYLRNNTINYSNKLLDSLEHGASSYDISVRHFSKIEDLRVLVLDGVGFNLDIDPSESPTENINYFSSSKD